MELTWIIYDLLIDSICKLIDRRLDTVISNVFAKHKFNFNIERVAESEVAHCFIFSFNREHDHAATQRKKGDWNKTFPIIIFANNH